jgi:hypothetical protein
MPASHERFCTRAPTVSSTMSNRMPVARSASIGNDGKHLSVGKNLADALKALRDWPGGNSDFCLGGHDMY